ncbi:DUF4252 domain-containing protein [Chryseobacterium indoltheticum]|uniref:DUF4252 domain-containing protein n=1 Tax=Chryseobacterium indoltheticum TaxID=254 RepID=A0A381FM93_9FLAO|nr:DUF4252 domain-containing protein [Chryseobacterium indoltheticum]AZA62178.1 DUF4252 domain-containing protein [Chryseobacterium indoltheticum]SUX47671.1 Protein of uncharacterised function (DUF2807) [Chryseobacterium indoltheticum]
MKKIFFILTIFLTSFANYSAQTEKLDQFFQSFENKGGVTSIDIKKPMFDLLDRIDISDEYIGKIKPIMRDVDGLKLLVFSKITFPDHLKSENVGQIKMNEEKSERIAKLLNSLKLNELMSMKSDDVSMKFLAENSKDGILENLIFNVDSKDENVVFILNGKMKMDDVNKIINSTNTKVTSSKISLTTNFASEDTSSYLSGENRNVGQFSGIDVSAGVKVVFTQENNTSVRVFADADKLQNVITKVENGILKVSIDNKGTKNLRFKNLSVNVSSPKMDRIKASSGSNFTTVNEIRGKEMTVDASSGSGIVAKFQISGTSNFEASSGSTVKASINSDKVLVKSSSGSSIKLEGNTEYISIDASSGASCKADQLTANIGVVESTSGSNVSVSAKDKLTVKASSAGSVKYRGNPQIESNISKSSAGSLNQIN